MRKALFLSLLLVFGAGCGDIMNKFLGEMPETESPDQDHPDGVGPADKPLIAARASAGSAWSKVSGQYSSRINTQYHQYRLTAPGSASMKVSISSGAIVRNQ